MNYLLSASLAMAIFYALYALAFRRLRFHALNRAYLLGALGLSLVIPLVELPAPTTTMAPPVQQLLGVMDAVPVSPLPEPTFVTTNEPRPVDWEAVVWAVYFVGVAAMALRLSIGLARLAKLARQPGRWEGGLKVILTHSPNASFFNLIFLNETGLTAAERAQVLAHEAAHARLGHSADRLLLEVLRVGFWFNPVMWLYQRSLTHLHELQADAAVVQRFEARDYARLLLQLHGGAGLPLANLFSRQPLKNRLAALFQPKPTFPMKKLLYLVVVPVALGATLFLAQTASPPVVTPAIQPSSATRPFLKGGIVLTIFLAKPQAVSMYLNWAGFNPYYVRRSAGTFQKIGYRAEVSGVGYDAKGGCTAASFKLIRNSDGKTATATFRVSDLLRDKQHVHLYANQSTGNFFVRSEADPTFEQMFPDVKIEKRKRARTTSLKSERQSRTNSAMAMEAPGNATNQAATSPADPAGHLALEYGRATMFLNLNHYDPEFLEKAKRFFQSNGVELKINADAVDAYGRFVSGKIALVKASGGSALIRAEHEFIKADGSRWVYLEVLQQSGALGAGSLPVRFHPPNRSRQFGASLLDTFGLWPFKKPDDC